MKIEHFPTYNTIIISFSQCFKQNILYSILCLFSPTCQTDIPVRNQILYHYYLFFRPEHIKICCLVSNNFFLFGSK